MPIREMKGEGEFVISENRHGTYRIFHISEREGDQGVWNSIIFDCMLPFRRHPRIKV